jgi:hypothetical protein
VVVTEVIDMAREGVYGKGDRGSKVSSTGITRTNASLTQRWAQTLNLLTELAREMHRSRLLIELLLCFPLFWRTIGDSLILSIVHETTTARSRSVKP